jgi:hypothetical protein
MPTLDAFTTVYQAILTALENDREWSELYAVGNRLDLTEDGKVRQILNRGRSLKPIMELEQGRFALRPFGSNSRSAEADQFYVLSLDSNQPKTINLVNAAKWDTLKALRRAGPELGTVGIIRDWHVQDGIDLDRPRVTDAPLGFAAVLTIMVSMYFDARLIA